MVAREAHNLKVAGSSPAPATKDKLMKQNKGLGDITEDMIKRALPKLAEKYKNCSGCARRKASLNKLRFMRNNKNANFK